MNINGKKKPVSISGIASMEEAISIRDKAVEVMESKEEWRSCADFRDACGVIKKGKMTEGAKKKVAENKAFWKDALEKDGGDNKKIMSLAGNAQFKLKEEFKEGYYDNSKLKYDDRYMEKGLQHPPTIQSEEEPQDDVTVIAMV